MNALQMTVRGVRSRHVQVPAEVLSATYFVTRWYVVQTFSRHEKRVAEQLDARGVEHFLPLYETVSQWKDRRVRVELPLFPGYVFVRLALRDRLNVLQIPSVVRLVGFNGHPEALPDEEMEILRSGLGNRLRAEPHPFLTVGRRIRIRSGPLQGLEGILVRRKSCLRFVLSVDLILRSIIVDVSGADLEPIFSPPKKGDVGNLSKGIG